MEEVAGDGRAGDALPCVAAVAALRRQHLCHVVFTHHRVLRDDRVPQPTGVPILHLYSTGSSYWILLSELLALLGTLSRAYMRCAHPLYYRSRSNIGAFSLTFQV